MIKKLSLLIFLMGFVKYSFAIDLKKVVELAIANDSQYQAARFSLKSSQENIEFRQFIDA